MFKWISCKILCVCVRVQYVTVSIVAYQRFNFTAALLNSPIRLVEKVSTNLPLPMCFVSIVTADSQALLCHLVQE